MSPSNIVIVGGGIVGVSTAYYLIKDPDLPPDTKVTIVEGTKIAAGASGFAGGFLARDEKWHTPETSELAALGFDLHKSLAEEYDGHNEWGYRALQTYHATVDPSQPPAESSPIPWLSHASSFTPDGDLKSTAQAMPGPLVRLLASKFVKDPRGQILLGTAQSVTMDESNTISAVRIQQTDDSIVDVPCDALVLAAGPWLGELAVNLLGEEVGKGLNVFGAQANSIILRTKEPLTAHAVFARIMMGGKEIDENEPEVYCRPDGTTYFCGTAGKDPLPPSAAKLPICNTALSKLHAEARALSPVFREENGASVVSEQACYLPRPERGRSLIGKVKGVEGVWVGGGHDVWGIVQGPSTGLVLSEMVLGKTTSADVSRLAP